jgi:asparagine synthase (glutamine-hydrolysing)
MCGIAGIIHPNTILAKQEVERITQQISHRGPDGSGIRSNSGYALGHRRLSIIDIEGGKQPLCNEDETIWITYNGELYNYKELRAQLIQHGHQFKNGKRYGSYCACL